MLEVEVKASVPDVETVRRRLRSLGAKRVGAERERDEYFQHPRRDFRRTDEALRLRFRDRGRRTAELTYKGPKFDRRTKSRVEMTVEAEAGTATRLLAGLGFKKSGRVVKRREQWRLRGLTVAGRRLAVLQLGATDAEAA
jgi:adenylate cyclase class 2